jgi:serine/threonine-protein kinase HipA
MVRVQNYRFDVQGFIIDWVRRDLLNIIFGNSDNHGRNTAFMKADNEIILAPIYDNAPESLPGRYTAHDEWHEPANQEGI